MHTARIQPGVRIIDFQYTSFYRDAQISVTVSRPTNLIYRSINFIRLIEDWVHNEICGILYQVFSLDVMPLGINSAS